MGGQLLANYWHQELLMMLIMMILMMMMIRLVMMIYIHTLVTSLVSVISRVISRVLRQHTPLDHISESINKEWLNLETGCTPNG